MEIVFEFDGLAAERDEAARDLVAWLNASRGLRGAAAPRMVPAAAGEQGAAADAAIVLASVAPLAKPFFAWLTERVKQRQVSMRITRTDEQLTINVKSPSDVDDIAEKVTTVLRPVTAENPSSEG